MFIDFRDCKLIMLDLVDKAMKFASKAHDGDYRKSEKIPYIYHPTMLAFYLMKYDFSDEVIAAALLHDTVEDTDTTIEDIEQEFGKEVKDLVAACTENKNDSWEDRKGHQIEAIKTAPFHVVAIKCADKLNNMGDIARDYEVKGDSIFENFSKGYDKQKWYYQGLLESFNSRDDFKDHPMLKALKSRVKTVFG